MIANISQSHPLLSHSQNIGAVVPAKEDNHRSPNKFSKNIVPARVPTLLIDNTIKGYLGKPVEEVAIHRPVTRSLLIALKEDIKDLFEGRIARFWSQALLVYKTGLQFFLHDSADAQIGKISSPSKYSRQYAAVHMSTLPALRVKTPNSDKIIAFGQGSFFHSYDNATIWLPAVVNQVDSSLDRHSRITKDDEYSFREKTIALLSLLSADCVSLKTSLKLFLYFALIHLENLLESTKEELNTLVLEYYIEVVNSYLKSLKESDYIIKALSGVIKMVHLDDETLYNLVQQQMHQLLISDMQKISPPVIVDPNLTHLLTTNVNPSRFKNFLEQSILELIRSNKNLITTTTLSYVKRSLLAANVRSVGLEYLAKIADQTELNKDLKVVLTEKLIPSRLQAMFNEIIYAISNNTKKPRRKEFIVVAVITELSRDPFLRVPDSIKILDFS